MTKSRMPKRKWTSGRGALFVIAFMLLASAVVRLGSGTGQAIAKEVAALSPPKADMSAPLQCENPAEIGDILAVLKIREEFLASRERALKELEQSLALAEDRVRANLVALVQAEQALAATIATSETAAESDLARLTSVYENMKPKQAAILFEEMTSDFAAGFVGRMRPDAAARIMAGLSPKAAYAISIILAGRNALVPTE